MTRRRFISFLACLFVFVLNVSAQNSFNIVNFNVVNTDNQLPISKATLFLPSLQKELKTDKTGTVRLGIPSGTYSIVVQHENYNIQSLKFSVKSDTTITLQLLPVFEEYALEEITVQGDSRNKNTENNGHDVLTARTLRVVPSFAGESDIIKTLASKPGAQASGEGASKVQVRGGSTDQNLYLADGNPIFKTSHLFGFFGTLNPQTVDRIDFYKGSFPAKYGGKLSSVIDVTTRKPNLDSLNLELELSPITGKIFAELPIVKKRNAIWISSRTTLFDKALRAARHNSPHSIMGFSDFQFKAYHEQNPRSRFSLNGYLDSDYFKDQYNVVDTIKDVSQLTWRNKFASFDHQYDFNDKQQIRTTIGTSEYFYRIDHQEGISKNSIEERKQMTTTINRLYTKLEFSTKSKSGIQTDVGLNYEIFKINPSTFTYKDADTTINNSLSKDTFHQLAGYFNSLVNLSSKDKLNVGLRASSSFNDTKNYFSLEPRLTFSHDFDLDNRLSVSYSKMSQEIHQLTNPGLGLPLDYFQTFSETYIPETSNQFSIGFFRKQRIQNQNIKFSIEGYYKNLNDILSFKPGFSPNYFLILSNRSTKPESVLTSGSGRSFGVEVMAEKPFGKLNGWISYTYSGVYHQFDELNKGNLYPAKNHQPHCLNIVANYNLNKRKKIVFDFNYTSGQRVTLPEYIYNLGTIDFENNSISAIDDNLVLMHSNSELNKYKMRDTHRLNVAYIQKYERKKWHGEWELSVYNIYNRKNAFYYHLDNEWKSTNKQWINATPKLKMVSLMPIIPSVSVRIKLK